MFSKLTGEEDQGQTRWQRAGRQNAEGEDEDVGRDGSGVSDGRDIIKGWWRAFLCTYWWR